MIPLAHYFSGYHHTDNRIRKPTSSSRAYQDEPGVPNVPKYVDANSTRFQGKLAILKEEGVLTSVLGSAFSWVHKAATRALLSGYDWSWKSLSRVGEISESDELSVSNGLKKI